MKNGYLDVLNCGQGHLSIHFDKAAAAEIDKARRMITDMLRRGYVLFVEIDGKHHRVQAFDATRDEYILKDPSELEEIPDTAQPELNHEATQQSQPATPETEAPAGAAQNAPLQPERQRRGRRYGMRSARVTGIAPTSGG